MTVELDDDTPSWAKTMVRSITRMFIALEKDHTQAIEYPTDIAVTALTIANLNKIAISEQQAHNTKVEQQFHRLTRENETLKQKLVNQEIYCHRDDMLIRGAPETHGENCGNIVSDIVR